MLEQKLFSKIIIGTCHVGHINFNRLLKTSRRKNTKLPAQNRKQLQVMAILLRSEFYIHCLARWRFQKRRLKDTGADGH